MTPLAIGMLMAYGAVALVLDKQPVGPARAGFPYPVCPNSTNPAPRAVAARRVRSFGARSRGMVGA
jgi:hypothetical protein